MFAVHCGSRRMGKTFDGTVTEGSLQAFAEVAGKKLPNERARHGRGKKSDTDDDELAKSLQSCAGNHEGDRTAEDVCEGYRRHRHDHGARDSSHEQPGQCASLAEQALHGMPSVCSRVVEPATVVLGPSRSPSLIVSTVPFACRAPRSVEKAGPAVCPTRRCCTLLCPAVSPLRRLRAGAQ